ncbi:hypothetical protein CHUUTOTORO_01690 [Serratia phage vB_SmaM-ChuuTotoro]|nr:hypothetical protein CHUUTOTORO_01690 [Serratia phage vB_SmaM-ChuuTotoro]
MATKTRQLVKAENLQAGDEIITGIYETTNEVGDTVVKPIYETVSGIILWPGQVEVVTAENPYNTMSLGYGEIIKTLR